MNPLSWWGLCAAVGVFSVYIIAALRWRGSADLATAINLLFSTAGAVGALRLIVFPFTDHFKTAVKAVADTSIWALSGEDGVFMVVGGLALLWITCHQVWKAIRSLKP